MPIPDEDEAAGCDGRNLRDRFPEAAYAGDARGLAEEPVDGGAPRRGACPAGASDVRNRAFPSPSPIRSAEEAEACADAPAADSVAAKAASADWHELVLRLARERSLTERECEVFALLARGCGSQSISDALDHLALHDARPYAQHIHEARRSLEAGARSPWSYRHARRRGRRLGGAKPSHSNEQACPKHTARAGLFRLCSRCVS